MLTVQIICVGKLKEAYWREACEEYAKRLQAFCKFTITEIPECRLPEHPSPAQIESALKTEGAKIRSAAGSSAVFALCIEGKALPSEQFADKINSLSVNGTSAVSFLIGSSYGLSGEVKQSADFRLSMSPMTFPHQLARVMLCEQIYRAFQIMNNGKYHK
jgi:Uncharacterized conserved protein